YKAERFTDEIEIVEAATFCRQDGYADVDFILDQSGLDRSAAAFYELESDFRIQVVKISDDCHQFACIHDGGQPDLYVALPHPHHIFKIVWQFGMETKDLFTLVEEDSAGIGQGDFLFVAVEQRHAKLCFNVLYRFADRRLGYVETV